MINFDTLLHLVGFLCMYCTMMHGSTNGKLIILCWFVFPLKLLDFIMMDAYNKFGVQAE